MKSHVLGLPRIGAHRELKFALERYWRQEISADELETVGFTLRQQNRSQQSNADLDWITVGDFAWYDGVLELSVSLGAIPPRFVSSTEQSRFDKLFLMARGGTVDGNAVQACELTKWFDTNYHYIVPEFSSDTQFQITDTFLFDQIRETATEGHRAKPVLLGPISYLWLGKETEENFNRLDLLPNLLLAYQQILLRLWSLGIEWVQLDEPILTLDLPPPWLTALTHAYQRLAGKGPKILLTTYFGSIEHHIETIAQWPIDGLHIDLTSAPLQLDTISQHWPENRVLSLGLINGRNVWRADLASALATLQWQYAKRGDALWISSSCSLLHTPLDLTLEHHLDDIAHFLAFGVQKLNEIKLLKKGALQGAKAIQTELDDSQQALRQRATSKNIHRHNVVEKTALARAQTPQRKQNYEQRKIAQRQALGLPPLPTTTIGSFPQTQTIRATRHAWQQGTISDLVYTTQIQTVIEETIRLQEKIGIDVLVHGEAERNDMVEYFAEHLNGFAVTQHGWVQSFGSRCVKPPIIFGDIERTKPITVTWTKYAQSLTSKPVKGMLTGPVTLLQWSFVRDDQPRAETCLQLALSIREEVADLENAGIKIIQIDEPAFREGLPLRTQDHASYFAWAIHAFKTASCQVADTTQIHTHMCYSEFSDIFDAIIALDADVITLETSRSDMALLSGSCAQIYPNEIGPGIYDIHSPNIPSIPEIVRRIELAIKCVPIDRLWINPDCGLKTRAWPEVEASLRNMVTATCHIRERLIESTTSSTLPEKLC